MGKILGSWSGIRKYLEQEMLAASLQGRIQYSCTSYPNMDNCKIFEIRVDGKTFKRFSMETVAFCSKETDCDDAWKNFWAEKNSVPVENKAEFDDEDFCNALSVYRNSPIEESLYHINPLVRMFAILDRRAGKRTLIKASENLDALPAWLRELYVLRISAETGT